MDGYLDAAGASWDDGPEAGGWITPLLDEFGSTLGHAVPAGYEAHVVVSIPSDAGSAGRDDYAVLDALLHELASRTGEQLVHVALWEGWGWLYDSGDDPRTADGMGVFVIPNDREALLRAQEEMARRRVARPAAPPLDLPHRRYHLWSGPLSAAAALRHHGDLPSLVWPEDRSWFIGAPIYTEEIALGADVATIRPVRDALRGHGLDARDANRHEVLQIDD